MPAFGMETVESCRSLGIVPADLFRPIPFVVIRPECAQKRTSGPSRTSLPIGSAEDGALPRMDFGDMHHNGCVMMGCGGNGGTAAYNHCLADEEPERPSHVFVGGEDMNSAHSPDSVVAVVGIKTGI